jgi:hypothetical protein
MVRSIPLAIGLLMDYANTPIPVQMLGVVCCIIQKFGARMDSFPCVGSSRVVGLGCECSSFLFFLLRPLDSLVPCLTLRHWKLTAGLRPICSFFEAPLLARMKPKPVLEDEKSNRVSQRYSSKVCNVCQIPLILFRFGEISVSGMYPRSVVVPHVFMRRGLHQSRSKKYMHPIESSQLSCLLSSGYGWLRKAKSQPRQGNFFCRMDMGGSLKPKANLDKVLVQSPSFPVSISKGSKVWFVFARWDLRFWMLFRSVVVPHNSLWGEACTRAW